ncbi:acetoacetate--CoA ligase [Nonomuraea sp. NPDC046570]|uniref:acetoacetate--CoA ligase n=1 Tax=Nonomuraea sp. NPDC046570 TaxID=3155255 RepID=UPI0033FDA786
MTRPHATTGEPLWTPPPSQIEGARVVAFARWLEAERNTGPLPDYRSLWRWSVEHVPEFWAAVWDYFGIVAHTPYTRVLTGDTMPGVRWFEGAALNYVDHVFRHAVGDAPAVIEATEPGPGGPAGRTEVSWDELRRQVAAVAATLRSLGVGVGDRVVGYLPNSTETMVAFLAAASLGAVWSVCGQDYGPTAACDRFAQLAPTVLVTADGYRHGGREHDRRVSSRELCDGLPTLRATIVVNRLGLDTTSLGDTIRWADATAGDHRLEPVAVPFDHPLWILFSSGTTGLPKGIVHGHGGVLVEHLKSLALHFDLLPGDRFLWHTTPSWMMWNLQVSGLLTGATVVCYDGSPVFPRTDALWALAAELGVTVLGTSPGYLLGCAKDGVHPGADHDLTALRILGSTGSVLPAESYHWVADHIGTRVQVVSTTGGTDVVTGFAGGAPTVPVWAGEISVPCLAVSLDAWDEHGRSVMDQVGELVVTRPMPSMPVSFWNDPDRSRYRQAYFDVYLGVWRHGDWITMTDRGSVLVHGRSDATLNRNGVRMGSADIYQAVERLPEISEALVVGVEGDDGSYWMPLFVALSADARLDQALCERIRTVIRVEVSPRHMPDEIIVAPGIPHTRTGKKLEIPVKRLFHGAAAEDVFDLEAVDDPALIPWFTSFHQQRRSAARDHRGDV